MRKNRSLQLSENQLEQIETLRLALLGKLAETTGEIYEIKTVTDCLSYKFLVFSSDGITATSREDLRISTFDNSGTITDRIEANVDSIRNHIRFQREEKLEMANTEIEKRGWLEEKPEV
jgi:hypothetical protein